MIWPRGDGSFSAGRRSARLPGEHGKATARKIPGLEGAVVDRSPIEIAALEPGDTRRVVVNVAGVAALFVAKLHKLGERLEQPNRLAAKDAGDVYRLFDLVDAEEMIALLRALLADDRSASATNTALGYARRLFATPASPGAQLAIQALRGVIAEDTVAAAIISYTRDVLERVTR